MPNCALINIAEGVVENVIVAEPDEPVGDGYMLVADPPTFVGPGVKFVDGAFVEPHAPLRSPPQIKGMNML